MASETQSVWASLGWRRVALASAVSRFGDSLDAVAFSWLVYQLTGSTVLMGAVLAVNALPNVLLASVSGVVADHFRKRVIVVICHSARGTIVFLTAVLFLTGTLAVWHLFVLTFLNSCFETFSSPAQSALTVHLVEPSQLTEANGASSSLSTAAQMAGLAAAGPVLAVTGLGGALLLDAFTFAVAALGIGATRVATDQRRPGALTLARWRDDLVEGMRFIAGYRALVVVLALALITNLAVTPLNVLEAPYVKDVLGAGPETLAALGFALLAGMLLGALLAPRAAGRWGTWPTVFGAFVALGAGFAFIGLPGWLPPGAPRIVAALTAYAATGFTLPFITTPLGAWVAARVPHDRQGRVFAVFGALGLVATPLGAAGSGALASVVSLPALLTAMGGLIVLAALGARVALGKVEAHGAS